MRWAYRTRDKYAELVPPLADTHRQLVVVRLRSRPEIDAWVAGPLSVACRPPAADRADSS